MKIGLIGIGDIAQKAYLPIITGIPDLDIVMASSNPDTRAFLARTYPKATVVETVDQLIRADIRAGFIHSATEAHVVLAKQFLEAGIPVYVDKPVAYSYPEVEALFRLAKRNDLTLRTGFNRRFIPPIKRMLEVERPSTIIYQKNRYQLPGETRVFVFDDYIHVLDSIRFLLRAEPEEVRIHGVYRNDLLHCLSVQLTTTDAMAIGIMNRESGRTEERVEVIAPGIKYELSELSDLRIMQDNRIEQVRMDDWLSLGVRRGFSELVTSFLDDVKAGRGYMIEDEESLKTHRLAERIVQELNKQ